MSGANLFAGEYLDRRAEERLRARWLEEARADPRTVYVAMRAGASLVRVDAQGGSHLALITAQDARITQVADAERMVLLGWYQQQRCVLVDLPEEIAGTGNNERFEELRPLASELPAEEAGLLAYARALNLWRIAHAFCSRCGARSVAARAGHVRSCPDCGQQSFPRLDPAVIVLVHDGARALLGRQASWPPGRYSTIAGFVEPGESLEDAVRREVLEETGITTQQVSYQSSQPWPFPSSLMLGFSARARYAVPEPRDGELEDARWFSRDEILAGQVLLPPRTAISRRLIETWLQAAPGNP